MTQRKPRKTRRPADDRGRPALPGPERGSSLDLRARPGPDGRYWIHGHHAVLAALRNPRRRLVRLLVTPEAEAQLSREIEAARTRLGERLSVARAGREEISRQLGGEAVHQGVAAEALPLPPVGLDEVISTAGARASLLVLDHVTDPHNVGAMLRSAAAFGALAVILTQHHSPPESGSLAKAASAGLEQVPLARVTNLVQTLRTLKASGFWCLGLTADGAEPLAGANLDGRTAFVLGAEGSGLRRLTREQCDLLVRLPTRSRAAHLNVSNAAAIALYEWARSAPDGEPEAG